MKNTDVKQSGHNCLLDRLPKKLTHDMVKRCKKKHCVVSELANRHRLTLRRVFTGYPNALSSHTYGVKPKKLKTQRIIKHSNFGKGNLNQGWSRTISRLGEEKIPLTHWLTSNIGAVVLYQDRGFVCLINPEILHRTNEYLTLAKRVLITPRERRRKKLGLKLTKNQSRNLTIIRFRKTQIFWFTSNVGAVGLYQERGFKSLINTEIVLAVTKSI